jgi:hypothetical protein
MVGVQKWKANWTNGTCHDWGSVTCMVSIRVPQVRPCTGPFHCDMLTRTGQDKSPVLRQFYRNREMGTKARFSFHTEHFASYHKEICFNMLIRPTYKGKES